MSMVERLQRAHLRNLVPYASARRSMSGGSVWLNANEAPNTPAFGNDEPALNRYPAFQSDAVNQAYADYAGVQAESILSARGSDEIIELMIRAFCEPGQDAIMICPPTYGMYAISAQTHGALVREVPLIETPDLGLQLDLSAMVAQLDGVKLIFVCSPSNPLGNNLALGDLRNLLESVGEQAFVIVDEAYIEFTDQPSVATWLTQYPQLVVTRTLSKAFGMAAIRCGFALAAPALIDCLRKVIAPYPMPASSLNDAQRALAPAAIAAMQRAVTETRALREQWLQKLQAAPWVKRLYPSATNFVLIQVDDAAALVAQCSAQGVLIRNQSSQRGLDNCVRISIGSAQELQQLEQVLPQ